MAMDGKQLKAGTVTEAKLAVAYSQTVLKRDGSVAATGTQNGGNQRYSNLGAPQQPTDAARLQDIQALNRKEVTKTVSLVNITLSGEQTVNGQNVVVGDRVLVAGQAAAEDNGIYVVSASAWSRSADADSVEELEGAVVYVLLGSVGAETNYQQIADLVTVGVTAQSWVNIGGADAASLPSVANKDMAASLTATDYALACATTIAVAPAGGSYVDVQINGVSESLGNGARDKSCYFSGDSGATARSWANIIAGDQLYWVGSIAGYELATTDRINFNYNS